ncbi:class B secretin G-protein coupled receptor GPRmth5 [Biomphalaria glabrata]|nr:hypothetical protein BgiMline_031576 [Biomphalaria glabrata]
MTEASMIAVLCFAFPFIHVKTDVQSGTCRYRCGSVVQSDCYCDDLCWLYKDCCPDFYQECPGVALYPQPVTLKNLFTYWRASILIQSSQCTRTMNGDYWVVSKCSLNPEIQLKFKESLYNIKQMKTKDSFLNYVSSFTLQDVVKGCEKLLTFKDRQTGIFIHFLFSDFQMEKHFTFANVFCALCNGFILTPNDKNLKCLSEVSYDVSTMSFSTLAEYLTEIQCELFQDSSIMRTCSLLNVESRISPEKKNTNDSVSGVSNSVTQLSRERLTLDVPKNMFGSYIYQTNSSESTNTKTEDFKQVNRSNYNITCKEGRTLTFSQVDVTHVQDDVTLKIYFNPEELPIDNVWFELAMSVDIYEPVIETCILSLCVLPGDTSRFCPHSTFLKIPYSQVVFYKSLLLVSEDISQVEEFLKENKHTFHSPKIFLDILKSSLPNVLVYFKTSYIKTNSGVVLCVDLSNIYKDDTSFILNLYQNSIDQICFSILLLKFSVLLQILRNT